MLTGPAGKNTAYVAQLAVDPKFKNQGLGSLLMDFCENLAKDEGFEAVQLDTATCADRLVNWYRKRNYRTVGETKWDGKTYSSYIFEKSLSPGCPDDETYRKF